MNIHDSLAECPLCGQPTGTGYGRPAYPRYRHSETQEHRQKSPLLVIIGLIGTALLIPALAGAGVQVLLVLHSAAAVACMWPTVRSRVRRLAVPGGEIVGTQEGYCGKA